MIEAEPFSLIVRDGTQLQGFEWNIQNPKAAVCMVHGLGEHTMRYEHVAQYFNDNSYSFYGFDLRGHGISEGKRGHSPSYERMLEDVEEVLMYIRSEHNDMPLFLYGHSMGGNLVTNYILKKSTSELKGAIISSPWLKLVQEPAKWKTNLGKWIIKFLPSLSQPNGLDTNDLTYDESVNLKYKNDPLVHDKISVRQFIEFSTAGLWALAKYDRLKVPIFMFHGQDDNICSYAGSQQFADSVGELATYQLWEKTKHEPHNDLRKEEVLKSVVDWMENSLV